jgi:hypothetical protein
VLSSPIPNLYDPTDRAWVFTPIPSLAKCAGEVSDMAFDSSDYFHVAIRTQNQVLKYDPTFQNSTLWKSAMTDNPEFLLYIVD